MNERVNVKIVIEHAGPNWVIEKDGIPELMVGNLVESARYVAPHGATIHVTITPAE